MYHLLNGIIKKSQSEYEEALKSFQTALNFKNIRISSPTKSKHKDVDLTLSDRVTLYLQMIDVYIITNQPVEASKLMDHALEEFNGTPENGRVIVANADLLLQQGNITQAIQLLRSIQPGQSYYLHV